ncbi:hypothetical protein LU298_13575 [Komagataeibacter intermedius]|uniref:Uncharacterized protein n=1 Tax=Komagataeibacter intermedius AF2 TaxID=1458464 RepID=A0A0N1F9Z9_9PROT|nr:hypothetical protein [Komagataeibacter intermedius]KPH85799.1 hypothetical protein GLUCOINTEAF2_0201054 [Komagataeibacter intermedius AF2]MCF3637520.1 hypothetical protein [Komagataeibacter intermedius]
MKKGPPRGWPVIVVYGCHAFFRLAARVMRGGRKPPTENPAAIAARGPGHPEKLTHEERKDLCGRVVPEENRRAT